MQNNFNTVIIQIPQIILECSEWIQYELEIFCFLHNRCVSQAHLDTICSVELWGFYLSDTVEWGTKEGKAGLAALSRSVKTLSISPYRLTKYKSLKTVTNSSIHLLLGTCLLYISQAGPCLISAVGFPGFWKGLCT